MFKRSLRSSWKNYCHGSVYFQGPRAQKKNGAGPFARIIFSCYPHFFQPEILLCTFKARGRKKKMVQARLHASFFHVTPIFSNPKSSYTVTKVFSKEADTTCERIDAYCVLPLLSLVPVFLVVKVWSQATSWYARCFLPRGAVHPHALGETASGLRTGSVPISLRCNLE